jgi:hypothetical protein
MGAWKVSKLWFMALMPVVIVAGYSQEPGMLLTMLSLVGPNAPLPREWAQFRRKR